MCEACKRPAGKYGDDLPNIKDIRAACRAGQSAKPVKPYLGPLSLSQALAHLRHHEACNVTVMYAMRQAADQEAVTA